MLPATVYSLAFGPDGALYVATMAHGLHRLTPAGAGFASAAIVLPGGADDEQINQLLRDPAGRLWAAGMRGLARYDGLRWRRMGAPDGLLESQIETITAAGADGLWVSYWNVDGLTRLRAAATGPLDRRARHATRRAGRGHDPFGRAGSARCALAGHRDGDQTLAQWPGRTLRSRRRLAGRRRRGERILGRSQRRAVVRHGQRAGALRRAPRTPACRRPRRPRRP